MGGSQNSSSNAVAMKESSRTTESKSVDENYKVYSTNDLEYSIPESWTENISSETQKFYYPEDGTLMVDFTELDDSITNEISRSEFVNGVTSNFDSYESESISESEITVAGTKAYQYDMNMTLSSQEYKFTLVLFDYSNGLISLYMTTPIDSDKDYSKEFKNILNSIKFTDEAMLEEAESTDETTQGEYYFDGTDLVTEDYKITITDYKVIKPREIGNEYGDAPVIAFWYDTTVAEDVTDTEYNPTTPWMISFEAVQDNNPNVINELNISSHPDVAYLDSQLETIKPGGTVINAVAYELSDIETPITLTATGNLFTDEKLESYDYPIK